MNVIPFKPRSSQIEAAVAAERQRCLNAIEELAAFSANLTTHQALCMAHDAIRGTEKGKSA